MISIIVAHADHRVIGYQNDMPWHLPKDLAYFKEKTVGKTLLMGRKTFEAMNGPLKKRTNIVVTSNKKWNHEGATVVYSLEDGIKMLQDKEEETFVIGGGKIYEAAMNYADRLYVTVIDLKTDGDTVFPDYHAPDWKEISSVKGMKDDKNPYDYYFKVFERAK